MYSGSPSLNITHPKVGMSSVSTSRASALLSLAIVTHLLCELCEQSLGGSLGQLVIAARAPLIIVVDPRDEVAAITEETGVRVVRPVTVNTIFVIQPHTGVAPRAMEHGLTADLVFVCDINEIINHGDLPFCGPLWVVPRYP